MGSDSPPSAKISASGVIQQIFKEAPYIGQLYRTLQQLPNATLINALTKPTPAWSQAAFECLLEYVTVFPNQCLPRKNDIEKFALSYIDQPLTTNGSHPFVPLAGQVSLNN